MPSHRELSLEKFIVAVNYAAPALLERYITARVPKEKLPPHLSVLNHDYIDNVLSNIDEESRELIFEDFRRLNDICERITRHVFSTSQLFDVETQPGETPQSRALRLFLDYPKAFEYAWSLYCIYGTIGKISRHRIPCPQLTFDENMRVAFERELRDYFEKSAKGDDCEVILFNDKDRIVLFIDRGSYFRAISYWQDKKRITSPIRPVREDTLLYDKTCGQLCITPLSRDREQYIKSFTRVIGYPDLANSQDRDDVYTLKPLVDGKFNWDGNKDITSIIPLEARLRLKGPSETVINIRSKNLRRTLEQELGDPTLASVELTHIKFRFTLMADGKEDKVTFVITPPYATDLIKKRHSEIITEYLVENGVQQT